MMPVRLRRDGQGVVIHENVDLFRRDEDRLADRQAELSVPVVRKLNMNVLAGVGEQLDLDLRRGRR